MTGRTKTNRRKATVAAPPREVRIIGGTLKRSKLSVADKPELRPTPDRVRETLFNWIGPHLEGAECVDAFAGSGALAFEAASRGARHVLVVEQDSQLVLLLLASKERLGARTLEIVRGDGIGALRRQPAASVDLVFLDPPFEAGLFDAALAAAARAIKPQGWIYLEAPQAWDDARLVPLRLRLYRYLKAGAVHAHLLQPTA